MPFLLALLFAAGARSQGCPPTAVGNDYFPLHTGNSWTYNYVNINRSGQSEVKTNGTLTRTVVGQLCGPTTHNYTVEERVVGRRIAGGDTTAVDYTTTLTFTETAGVLNLSTTYLNLGVAVWRYEENGPETLVYTHVHRCSSGSENSEIRLERDIGMVYFSSGGQASSNGCSRTLQLTAFAVEAEPTPAHSAGAIRAYPNPAADALTVEIEGPPGVPGALALINASGQVVRRWEARPSAWRGSIQLNGLAPGLYLLRAMWREVSVTRRIVIQ